MAELDPVIHAAARLKIVAALATLKPGAAITFPTLQKSLDMTAGNLSTHLRKLEDAAYVGVEKTIEGRSPVKSRSGKAVMKITGRRGSRSWICWNVSNPD